MLAHESTWLRLKSEQMGFLLRPTGEGEHKERAEELDSSQRVHDHLIAYHLANVITKLHFGIKSEMLQQRT